MYGKYGRQKFYIVIFCLEVGLKGRELAYVNI